MLEDKAIRIDPLRLELLLVSHLTLHIDLKLVIQQERLDVIFHDNRICSVLLLLLADDCVFNGLHWFLRV